VQSYKTGVYVASGDFSAKSCNTWVRQYNKNFDKKTIDWWDAVLEHYEVVPDSEPSRIGEMSMLDDEQAALPMSSP
jgi:hypothetical protein